MLQTLKKIYDKVPKEIIFFIKYIPDRLLFGKSYSDWKGKVSFDTDIINQKLLETLVYARVNTQFGKENIPYDLTLDNVREILEKLPLVSSYDLSTNLDYYLSKEFKGKNSYSTTTGGSGGNPTSILLSTESYGLEWRHIHHIWSLANYEKSKDLKLTLRGKSLKGSKLVEFNPVYNELLVDTFKVKDSNFQEFIKTLKQYNIKYIHGYPSLLKEFMVLFEKYDYRPNIKGVFLGSEGASVDDKKCISEFFNCKVVHWYGQSERVALAVDIECNDIFRVYTSYGYPRIVDGELVATSFVNKALPLINYRTGDSAEVIENDRYIIIKNLKSRRGKDFIYLDKDKKIPTTSINLHSKIQDDIISYQIHQHKFAKIEIRVLQKITSKMNSNKLLEIFTLEMKENLKDFEVEVKLVKEDEIVRSHRGKKIFLVQELKN